VTTVQCFWIEPTAERQQTLRRYSYRQGEPGMTCETGYHHAVTVIEELTGRPPRRSRADPSADDEVSGDNWPHDDPRWPMSCSKGCGYVFLDTDHWQHNVNQIYAGGGWRGTLLLGVENVPPGAMWDAWWMSDVWKGPDGLCLTVQLPDGAPWSVDGPATGGGHWTRTGDPRADPPTVDVNPSIASGEPQTYHGHLRHGKLVD
jgi:hypothetical protein